MASAVPPPPDNSSRFTNLPSEASSERVRSLDKEKALVDASPAPILDWSLLSLSTALGAFFIQMCSYGYTTSFGVYQDYYTQYYLPDQSASAISWIGSTNSFLFEIGGLLAGRLHDRGYFYHLMIGGSLLQAFSLFMLSLAKPGQFYQIFLAQGVGSGIAGGMVFIPSIAILSHHFDKHLGMAMTLVTSGTCLGAVIHPILLNNLINGPLGFANGVRVSAGLIAGLMLIGCLLMRTRTTPPAEHVQFLVAARKCLRDSAYIFAAIGLAAFMITFYYPLFYLQLDSATHGLGKTFSFYSLAIMNGSAFFAQMFAGMLANKFCVDKMITVASLGTAVFLFGMIGIHTVASVVVFGVFYGFFGGMFLALWGPIVAFLTPDPAELGVRLGIPGVLFAIGGLFGPPISGALLTDKNLWYRGAIFNGALGIFGTTMLMIMKVIIDRRRHASAAA
ncbi:hypothetical protein HYDPIDRAFT_134829 [Hydnomerulius pinastri MD-312]|uniref:Major facilitator superfamily (MFS) profile domain-containing protein n=1 Tax=Hydnomerulius pinastri MD-312 TaxID=994086 RepID=A0A0C9VBP8_9AGAM|nr:hypothetical protein HYDPIDRAFT_134829 [Hydnomerulius pinastri MD-312]